MNATALLLELVEQKGDATIQGRIVLQKLAYFAKIFGKMSVPEYRMNIYGPFSGDVADALQDCVSGAALTEINGIGRSIKFENLCRTYGEDMKKVHESVEKALSVFGNKSPQDLELLATTHYIYEQQRYLYREEYDKDTICNDVKRIKGGRFTEDQIHDAYSMLAGRELI